MKHIKAKFFALYYGQHVFRYHKGDETLFMVQGGCIEIANSKDSFLLLRTVDMLRDDEKTPIAMLGYFGKDTNLKQVDILLKDYIDRQSIVSGSKWWFIQDYLRSIGILIPFTYLDESNNPITLTPSQLIEKGFC